MDDGILHYLTSLISKGVNWTLLWEQRFNLLQGASMTIKVTTCALAIGCTIGIVIALMRLSRHRLLRWPATVYVEIFRNTPMLVQILLMYFGVFPKLGLGRTDAFWAGIAALGLNSAAYLGEIFRGGIQSIDKGQSEAALSLGMKKRQVMQYVVLPQALVNALPALGNEFITLIKDSSLLQAITVGELTYRAMRVAGSKLEHWTMFIGIGIVYFVMCFSMARILGWLERRLRVGSK